MVKLQEVEDEHFSEEQQGPKVEDDGDYVDTDSEISSDEDSDDDDDTFEETVYERLVALKDMIPPKHRARVSGAFNKTYSFISSGLQLGGKTLWILSTSAIMLGVPYALAVGEEQQMVEMEKEMKVCFSAYSFGCPVTDKKSTYRRSRLLAV
jgi:import receptor subunit TOM22